MGLALGLAPPLLDPSSDHNKCTPPALVEHYGFTMARKEPLNNMIARMAGTLLLHGRDVTAAPRFIELVPHVKAPAEKKQ